VDRVAAALRPEEDVSGNKLFCRLYRAGAAVYAGLSDEEDRIQNYEMEKIFQAKYEKGLFFFCKLQDNIYMIHLLA
jgi:hypothetical protein